MSRQIGSDLFGVIRGLQMVSSEVLRLQENYVKHSWANSSLKTCVENVSVLPKNITTLELDKVRDEAFQRSSMVVVGIRVFAEQWQGIRKSVGPTPVSEESKIEKPVEQIDSILKLTPLAVENLLKPVVKHSKTSETSSDEFTKKITGENAVPKAPHKLGNDSVIDEMVDERYSSKKGFTETDTSTKNLTRKYQQSSTSSTRPSKVNSTRIKRINLAKPEVTIEHSKMSVTSSNELKKRITTEKSVPEAPHKSETNTVLDDKINKQRSPKKASNEKDKSTRDLTRKYQQSLTNSAKPSKVPSTRIGRMISFGSLAAGLGIGTVAEVTRRTLGIQQTVADNPFLTPANAERIVSTLCKVRGAALKIGQILSIQDSNVISPELQKVFERVRQAADFMPEYQVDKVMREQLGHDWRHKFLEFDMKPFAAASIGQVHYGKNRKEMELAVKIQYPGVAKGINSDIENLVGVLNLWNIFPEGMFIDKVVEVAKKELSWEVDYEREAMCTKEFKKLLSQYPDYYVPNVIDELSSKEVFSSELIHGLPVDKCVNLDSDSRHRICHLIMELCLYELFKFRYMQTDPNWSNFFYNQDTKKLILLDFGATRSYDKQFMDKYIRVIKAAADKDHEKVLDISKDMGFLTGFESKTMERAHVDTVMILGEVFGSDNPEFNFAEQDTTLRVTKLVPTILSHRLCAPPEEIYSLHRKLSGVFLLCSKLKVKMPCRDMFMRVYDNYVFD